MHKYPLKVWPNKHIVTDKLFNQLKVQVTFFIDIVIFVQL